MIVRATCTPDRYKISPYQWVPGMTKRRWNRRQLMMGGAAGLALAGTRVVRLATSQEDDIRRGGVPNVALPQLPAEIGQSPASGWETAWVRSLIYDRPLRMNRAGEIVAGVCIAYTPYEDERQLELTVRRGVMFSNGVPLAARDIAASIERAIGEETGEDAWRWSEVERVETIDDERVLLRLREPDVTLTATLASQRVPVTPDGTGLDEGAYPGPPAGSGPFVPSQQDGGVRRFRRNGRHWVVGQPRFDGLNVLAIEQEIERTTQLVTGLVDVVPDVPALDIPLLDDDPRISLYGEVSRRQCALVMRLEREPLHDDRVRRLLASAIDRDSLVQAATADTAEPSNWLFPPEHWAGPVDTEIDPPASADELREEFAALGFRPGWSLRLICPDVDPPLANASILLQEQLAQVGIAVTVDLLDPTAMRSAIAVGEFDLMMDYLPSWIDPHEVAHPWLHSTGSRNVSGFRSMRVDRLLALARTNQDEEGRGNLYREIQRILAYEVPLIPLFATPWFDGVRSRIEGYDYEMPVSGRGVASAWFGAP